MWIDFDAENNQGMIHLTFDLKGNFTDKKMIIIPAFDLYYREIGDSNGKN